MFLVQRYNFSGVFRMETTSRIQKLPQSETSPFLVVVSSSGTTGRGIAIALCRAGYHTTLVENDAKFPMFCL
ncbi:hypothetical protein GCK32_018229, partial [Trichostrongylus colubriformis]